MFNSDDEKDDGEDEADLKWRMERYEREKFISEQQVWRKWPVVNTKASKY